MIDKSFGTSPHHQGRCLGEIELKDEFENMGAQMLREVASKANDKAGDSTTTATVLLPRRSSKA